jgi:hypothetical protein
MSNNETQEFIICRYVIRKGKKVYPKSGKFFRFPVRPAKGQKK